VTPARLSRRAGHGPAAAPARIAHLGLGNFFRAHECWYTAHAPQADQWGIVAFTGRASVPLVERLPERECLYTLVSRTAADDRFEVIPSLSGAHAASEHDAWLDTFTSPELAVVTTTVTEAGYLRGRRRRSARRGALRQHGPQRRNGMAATRCSPTPDRSEAMPPWPRRSGMAPAEAGWRNGGWWHRPTWTSRPISSPPR